MTFEPQFLTAWEREDYERQKRGEDPRGPTPAPEGMVSPQERDDLFRRELETVINRHSRENGSDTPDFILGQYLFDCLASWDRAMALRTEWYKPKRHTISGSDAAEDDDL